MQPCHVRAQYRMPLSHPVILSVMITGWVCQVMQCPLKGEGEEGDLPLQPHGTSGLVS